VTALVKRNLHKSSLIELYSIHSVQAHCSHSRSHTSNGYSKLVEALLKTHSWVFFHTV